MNPAVVEDVVWPAQGCIQRVEAGADVVIVDQKHPWYHVGMQLSCTTIAAVKELSSRLVGNAFNEAVSAIPVATVVEMLPDGVTFRVTWESDDHRDKVRPGIPFYTWSRTPMPDAVSMYQPWDFVTLFDDFKERLARVAAAAGGPGAPLTDAERADLMFLASDDGTPQQWFEAFTDMERMVQLLKLRASELKLIGPEAPPVSGRPGAVNFEALFAQFAVAYSAVCEAAYFQRRAALRVQDLVSGRDSSAVYPCLSLWNMQKDHERLQQEAETKGDLEKHRSVKLLWFVLTRMHTLNVRHDGTYVYVPRYTEVDTWVPPPGNPCCVVVGCVAPACFGDLEGGAARVRCEVHRSPEDTDLRYMAPDPSKPNNLRVLEGERTTARMPTRFWEPVYLLGMQVTMAEWFMREVPQELSDPLVQLAAASVRPFENIALFIRNWNHAAAQRLVFVSHYYSFSNGVYNIATNTFYRYGTDTLPEDCVCVNHIDQTFMEAWMDGPPNAIRVPGYDEILQCQGFSPDVADWMDTFQGRLLFPIGFLDNWQKLLYIRGMPGTGKTTMLEALTRLVGPGNAANISANVEEQWAIGADDIKKVFWYCGELPANWKLRPETLMNMVGGENVQLQNKHQTAKTQSWKSHGIVCGNTMPSSWIGSQGMTRRIMPFVFSRSPLCQNASVSTKLFENLGAFLVRIARQYTNKASRYGQRGVDEVLPPELRAASETYLAAVQPLLEFLKDTSDFVIAPREVLDRIVPVARKDVSVTAVSDETLELLDEWSSVKMTEVQAQFKIWWQANKSGTPPPVTNHNGYGIAVRHFGLHVDMRGKTNYLVGIKHGTESSTLQIRFVGGAAGGDEPSHPPAAPGGLMRVFPPPPQSSFDIAGAGMSIVRGI